MHIVLSSRCINVYTIASAGECQSLLAGHVEVTVALIPCFHKLLFLDDDTDHPPPTPHYQRIMLSQEESEACKSGSHNETCARILFSHLSQLPSG